ncbi:MAG: hypothetical protein OEN49_09600 [Gammaproteobacteria bacterium]|nr:hypothetical protein [Gammaproteobacteria bacterium]
MNPIKPAVCLFAVDVVLLALMLLVFTGCVTVNINVNMFGKQEPVLTIDTPYKTVAPWIDAGGDVMAEAGDTDVGGADVMVPLTPPEMPEMDVPSFEPARGNIWPQNEEVIIFDGTNIFLHTPNDPIEDIEVPE